MTVADNLQSRTGVVHKAKQLATEQRALLESELDQNISAATSEDLIRITEAWDHLAGNITAKQQAAYDDTEAWKGRLAAAREANDQLTTEAGDALSRLAILERDAEW